MTCGKPAHRKPDASRIAGESPGPAPEPPTFGRALQCCGARPARRIKAQAKGPKTVLRLPVHRVLCRDWHSRFGAPRVRHRSDMRFERHHEHIAAAGGLTVSLGLG